MIELKNAIFDDYRKPLDVSYNNGINLIPYESFRIFDDLKIRDTELSKGELLINGFSIQENSSVIPFVLDINSSSISLSAIFVCEMNFKNELLKSLQSKLLLLKDLDVSNSANEINKIKQIFDCINVESLGYVLIDFNNLVNCKKIDLINQGINSYIDKICFIELEESIKEMEEISPVDEILVDDLFNKEIEPKKEKKVRKKHINPFSYFKRFIDWIKTRDYKLVRACIKKIFKEDVLFLFFAILFSGFSTLGCYFFPSSFISNKTSIGIILLIDAILFFILSFYLSFSSLKTFYKKNYKKLLKWYLSIFYSLFNLIGVAIGFALSIIFSSNGIIIPIGDIVFENIVGSIIVGSMLFILPIVLQIIFTLVYKKKN